jgi:hypothetical protein
VRFHAGDQLGVVLDPICLALAGMRFLQCKSWLNLDGGDNSFEAVRLHVRGKHMANLEQYYPLCFIKLRKRRFEGLHIANSATNGDFHVHNEHAFITLATALQAGGTREPR